MRGSGATLCKRRHIQQLLQQSSMYKWGWNRYNFQRLNFFLSYFGIFSANLMLNELNHHFLPSSICSHRQKTRVPVNFFSLSLAQKPTKKLQGSVSLNLYQRICEHTLENWCLITLLQSNSGKLSFCSASSMFFHTTMPPQSLFFSSHAQANGKLVQLKWQSSGVPVIFFS